MVVLVDSVVDDNKFYTFRDKKKMVIMDSRRYMDEKERAGNCCLPFKMDR
jgi:hypothetical protein